MFLFQAEDGIRYLVRSRGLGDVYKRQHQGGLVAAADHLGNESAVDLHGVDGQLVQRGEGLSLIHI